MDEMDGKGKEKETQLGDIYYPRTVADLYMYKTKKLK